MGKLDGVEKEIKKVVDAEIDRERELVGFKARTWKWPGIVSKFRSWPASQLSK